MLLGGRSLRSRERRKGESDDVEGRRLRREWWSNDVGGPKSRKAVHEFLGWRKNHVLAGHAG